MMRNLFSKITWQRCFVLIGFAASMLMFYVIYHGFFPTKNGTLGHDWNLSGFAFGYYKYQLNGLSLWRIAYNPAICHSTISLVPGFPTDLQSLLTWAGVTPTTVVFSQILFIAALGFWGMYLLLAKVLKVDVTVAVFGAVLFTFNGFFAARALIGHAYYPSMLIPLLLYAFTTDATASKAKQGFYGVFAGVLLFYLWYYGVMVIAAWVFLAFVLLLLVLFIRQELNVRTFLFRSAVSLVIGIGLSMYLLIPTFDSVDLQVAIAQRVSYKLPGFVHYLDTLAFIFQSLFMSPESLEDTYNKVATNIAVLQQRHEFEFGLTPAPLLIYAAFLIAWGRSIAQTKSFKIAINKWQLAGMLVIGCLLILPTLYTTYDPLLSGIFKKIPLLNATVSPQRSYFIYIPFIVVTSALALNAIPSARIKHSLAMVAMVLTVFFVYQQNRDYYQNQPYNPQAALQAHAQVVSGYPLPPIERIGALVDASGRQYHSQILAADVFAQGIQYMGCYVPGYSSTPVELKGTLHPGSIWDVKDGRFNIKNPACNSYPKENGCKPGDHFWVEQREWVTQYINYRSFPVYVPHSHAIAGFISLATLCAVILTALIALGMYVRRLWSTNLSA